MASVNAQNQQLAEPTWDVAYLFPNQGDWSEEEYCALNTNRLVELSEGKLEVLSPPTEEHQTILACLHSVIRSFVIQHNLGKVLFSPLRVRLWKGKIREPDIVFMLEEHSGRRENRYWHGADLVVEVVSEDDPDRDWVIKREEYAKAEIPEFWIVDPRDRTISVLSLDRSTGSYDVAGRYAGGEQAKSVLLPGVSVDVAPLFEQ